MSKNLVKYPNTKKKLSKFLLPFQKLYDKIKVEEV